MDVKNDESIINGSPQGNVENNEYRDDGFVPAREIVFNEETRRSARLYKRLEKERALLILLPFKDMTRLASKFKILTNRDINDQILVAAKDRNMTVPEFMQYCADRWVFAGRCKDLLAKHDDVIRKDEEVKHQVEVLSDKEQSELLCGVDFVAPSKRTCSDYFGLLLGNIIYGCSWFFGRFGVLYFSLSNLMGVSLSKAWAFRVSVINGINECMSVMLMCFLFFYRDIPVSVRNGYRWMIRLKYIRICTEKVSAWWTKWKPWLNIYKWQIVAGALLGVIVCFIVYKVLKKVYRKNQKQGFFDKKEKSLLQLATFVASLGLTGKLFLWRSIQPYITCCDWIYDLFSEGETECKNSGQHPCRATKFNGSITCVKCAQILVASHMEDIRTENYAVRNPSKVFPILMEDIALGQDVEWYRDFNRFTKEIILKTKNHLIDTELFEAEFKSFFTPGYICALLRTYCYAAWHEFRPEGDKIGDYDGKLYTKDEFMSLTWTFLYMGKESPINSMDLPMPLGVSHIFVTYDNGVKIFGLIVKDEDTVSVQQMLRDKYNRYLRNRITQYMLMGFFVSIVIFAYFVNDDRYNRLKYYLYGKVSSFFGWKIDKEDEDFEKKLNTYKDNKELASSIIAGTSVIATNQLKALDRLLGPVDEGGGDNRNRRGGNNRQRFNKNSEDTIADLRRMRNKTYHQDVKEAEREYKAGGHPEKFASDEQEYEEYKEKVRNNDFRIKQTPTSKDFIFYSPSSIKKLVTRKGVEMFPFGPTKTKEERLGPSMWAKNADEYEALFLQGYRARMKPSEGAATLKIPWGVWQNNRQGFTELQNLVQFYYDNHAENREKFGSYPGVLSESGMRALQSLDWDGIHGELLSVLTDLSANTRVGKHMPQDMREDLINRFNGRNPLNPFEQNEGNVQEIVDNTCPYALFFNHCPVGGCMRNHDISHKEKSRDESSEYPLEIKVDYRCAFELCVKTEDGYDRVGVCTRLKSGGFITARHVVIDDLTGGFRTQLCNYYIKDHTTPKDSYVQIYQSYEGIEDLKRYKASGELGDAYIWDYIKLFVDPIKDNNAEFLERTFQYAVSPTCIREDLLVRIRMMQIDRNKHFTSAVTGGTMKLKDNELFYININTESGDSGSPIFDSNGRFIGIHKSGNPNKGITFTFNGKVPPFFISSQPLNCQSPCIRQ